MPARSRDRAVFHLDLGRSLRLHRWLAAGIFGAGLALAAGYVWTTGPIYSAQSQVNIQPAPSSLMDTGSAVRWPFDANTYQAYIQQQMRNITRADVLDAALEKMAPGSWQRSGETPQAAAERLGHSIEVARLGNSYQISIVCHANKPDIAAQICNAVVASFIEISGRDLKAGDPQRIELLREEEDRLVKEASADFDEQDTLHRQLGVAAVSAATPDPYDAEIREARAQLARARTASDEAAARLTALTSGNSESSAALDAEADQLAANDAGLVSLKTSLNQRRAQLISQMANLSPNDPQYQPDTKELAQIDASLSAMMQNLRRKAAQNILDRLKNDLERTSMVERKLNVYLARLAREAGSASPRLQRSHDLAIDIQRLQNRYMAVDEQLQNLLMDNKAPGTAYLSAAALPPLHASESTVLRRALMLAIGSLIFAILAAVAAHHLDRRIYIATDVERVIGLSPIAQLPDFDQVPEEVGEEYMLRLAAAIEHAYKEGEFKSCIFTGAGPETGVTTLATRVRKMLEAMGQATVLVDASGTPPPVAASQQSAVISTDLLATPDSRVSALLQQIAGQMDADAIVIVDTAPLLASGETEYLARYVDSAVVVIQSGSTTRDQAREVAQTLQRLEVTAVGFVLNRVSIDKANPSFRQSLRAVEQRLAVQARLSGPRSSRSTARHGREAGEVLSVVPKSEPEKHPAAAPAPDPSPQPAPERPVAPPAPPGRDRVRAGPGGSSRARPGRAAPDNSPIRDTPYDSGANPSGSGAAASTACCSSRAASHAAARACRGSP